MRIGKEAAGAKGVVVQCPIKGPQATRDQVVSQCRLPRRRRRDVLPVPRTARPRATPLTHEHRDALLLWNPPKVSVPHTGQVGGEGSIVQVTLGAVAVYVDREGEPMRLLECDRPT